MNSDDNEKLENVLDEALRHYEEGKSIPEILDLFPEHKKDLEEIFEAIELVRQGKNLVEPPKEYLSKIIERIQVKGVTYLKIRRYSYKDKPKGRTSFIKIITSQFHKIMNFNWKTFAPIAVIVIAFAVFFMLQSGVNFPMYPEQEEALSGPPQYERELKQLPVATGRVDDTLDATLTALLNEEVIFNDEDLDILLITADSEAISDFGQSYNENEL